MYKHNKLYLKYKTRFYPFVNVSLGFDICQRSKFYHGYVKTFKRNRICWKFNAIKKEMVAVTRLCAVRTESTKKIKVKQHTPKLTYAFDRDPLYGPTVGLTRWDRWKRAYKYNLSPPKDITMFWKRGATQLTTNQPLQHDLPTDALIIAKARI